MASHRMHDHITWLTECVPVNEEAYEVVLRLIGKYSSTLIRIRLKQPSFNSPVYGFGFVWFFFPHWLSIFDANQSFAGPISKMYLPRLTNADRLHSLTVSYSYSVITPLHQTTQITSRGVNDSSYDHAAYLLCQFNKGCNGSSHTSNNTV